MSKRLLHEMFGLRLVEVTPGQAERELNGSQSVFKLPGSKQQGQQKHTKDTARMQADVDSAQSVVKEEGQQGITLSGDRETLDALMQCLQEAEHAADDQDVANWAGNAWKAVAAGIRGNGSFNLPKFEGAPEDLMPDEEPGEEF